MKQLVKLILAFFVLSSCSDNTNTTSQTPEDQAAATAFVAASKGFWVLSDYISAVGETQSAFKAAEKLKGIVALYMDGTGKTDSIEAGGSYNNHEGFSFSVYLSQEQNQRGFRTSITDYDNASAYYELSMEGSGGENLLVLHHYRADGQLQETRKFSKVLENFEEQDTWGINYLVNQKLFAGGYLLTDKANTETTIKLESDGTVEGHNEWKSYYVVTDFEADPEAQGDMLVFNMNQEGEKAFAFTISNGTILLYQASDHQHTGEVQYKLIRQ